MPTQKLTIKIENVLGGQNSLKYFGKEGSFSHSLAIDPDLEATTGDNKGSGFLVPVPTVALTGATMDAQPLWMNTTSKDDDVYVYDRTGQVYTVTLATQVISDLNNGAALSGSSGNGSSYYDNFQYFAKNSDICRYGRLDGARTYNQTYWTSSLSMSPLGNGVSYPSAQRGGSGYPNHPMHVHSDDKLYVGDVMVNNGINSGKGAVHYIRTKKTTTEGDTNNGSTYNALDLGYGIWPTDIDSYGTDLAIAAYEGNTTSGNTRGKRAKIFFWDTTSASFNKEVELPDPLCSALENVNGVLYAFCGNPGQKGVRVLRFIGGYSFEEVLYLEDSCPPYAGATDHIMSRVLFGGFSTLGGSGDHGCIYAIGSNISGVSNGLFNVMRSVGNSQNLAVSSILVPENTDFVSPNYYMGIEGAATDSIERNATTYGAASFRSEVFRIGKEFEITSIKIPLAQAIAANMTLAVVIDTDNLSTSTTVATINSTTYSGSERSVTIHPSVRGKHDFVLRLNWSGTALLTVGLPIEIEVNTWDS